jgi:trimethylamine:corrinoid methyltransferase-like protein
MNNVRPRLTMMNEEQIHEAHRNVLKVLSETGVRVDSPRRKRLTSMTGAASINSNSAKIVCALGRESPRCTIKIQLMKRWNLSPAKIFKTSCD